MEYVVGFFSLIGAAMTAVAIVRGCFTLSDKLKRIDELEQKITGLQYEQNYIVLRDKYCSPSNTTPKRGLK